MWLFMFGATMCLLGRRARPEPIAKMAHAKNIATTCASLRHRAMADEVLLKDINRRFNETCDTRRWHIDSAGATRSRRENPHKSMPKPPSINRDWNEKTVQRFFDFFKTTLVSRFALNLSRMTETFNQIQDTVAPDLASIIRPHPWNPEFFQPWISKLRAALRSATAAVLRCGVRQSDPD